MIRGTSSSSTTSSLEEVRRDCEGDKDAIDDFLRDHFHEHISQQMEDPFFDPSGEDCELYFETGSQGELERLMKLFILTEPDIEAHEDEEVRVYAAMDGTDPHLESSDCYHSERLEGLAEIALSENRLWAGPSSTTTARTTGEAAMTSLPNL